MVVITISELAIVPNSGLVNFTIIWLGNDWASSRLANVANHWLVILVNTWCSNICTALAAVYINKLVTLTNKWLGNTSAGLAVAAINGRPIIGSIL